VALKGLQLRAGIFSIFFIGTLSIIILYYVANVTNRFTNPHRSFWRDILRFLFMFPVFLSMSMGLSLHNTIAVFQGYIGRKSEFVRTPKFNIRSLTDSFKKTAYQSAKLKWTTIIEGLLSLYFIYAVFLGFEINDLSLVIFHILLAAGYGAIFYLSVKHVSIK